MNTDPIRKITIDEKNNIVLFSDSGELILTDLDVIFNQYQSDYTLEIIIEKWPKKNWTVSSSDEKVLTIL